MDSKSTWICWLSCFPAKSHAPSPCFPAESPVYKKNRTGFCGKANGGVCEFAGKRSLERGAECIPGVPPAPPDVAHRPVKTPFSESFICNCFESEFPDLVSNAAEVSGPGRDQAPGCLDWPSSPHYLGSSPWNRPRMKGNGGNPNYPPTSPASSRSRISSFAPDDGWGMRAVASFRPFDGLAVGFGSFSGHGKFVYVIHSDHFG